MPLLKSYSASISGSRLVLAALFIVPPFAGTRDPSTDDAYFITPFGEYYHEKTAPTGLAEGNEAIFVLLVQGVVDGQGQRVGKHGCCFVKAYALFLEIGPGFLVIPVKGEAHGLSRSGHPGHIDRHGVERRSVKSEPPFDQGRPGTIGQRFRQAGGLSPFSSPRPEEDAGGKGPSSSPARLRARPRTSQDAGPARLPGGGGAVLRDAVRADVVQRRRDGTGTGRSLLLRRRH